MKEFTDKDFGKVFVRENSRARQMILRVKTDGVYITVPPRSSLREIEHVLEQFRERLLQSREKIVSRKITPDYPLEGGLFRLKMVPGENPRFLCRTTPEGAWIIYPPSTDFENEDLQLWLRKVITELLRKRARQVLPSLLGELSRQYGLSFRCVKITSSQGRWGSCSSQKSISLSLYLVLLPVHLIEYVLLHELCHTVEMNHGPAFWELLDRISGKDSRQLRKELRNYHTGF